MTKSGLGASRGNGCSTSVAFVMLIVGSILLFISWAILGDECQPAFEASPGDESANSLCVLQDMLGWGALAGAMVLLFAGCGILLSTQRRSRNF